MQNIVIDKPYVPVPPYHGRIWPKILSHYANRMLRKKFGIEHIECVNADRLKESIAAGHGVLLSPNHCRDEDPFVLGALSNVVGTPFFIMASWHLFMENRLRTFLLRRAGAFSIYREGIDRTSINSAIEILATAERPLVVFPEGMISRTNDRLNDLLEGSALMPRTAAKKRAKMTPPGKVVVHPIALRYRFKGDIEKAVSSVLDDIEARLSWQRQTAPMIDRIQKVGNALLTLKELEYLGQSYTGDIGPRLDRLTDSILGPLEDQWLKQRHTDSVPTRVKRLRSAILPDMAAGEIDEPERAQRWKQLADLYLAQQLAHYPPDYVRSNPSSERLLETVERFEEDLTDKIRLHGPIHATITVGTAIEVSPTREGRGSGDPLLEQIAEQLKSMLGIDAVKV
jgi:1-acyl-sn-glycerol-3-phosphate acyltransferase